MEESLKQKLSLIVYNQQFNTDYCFLKPKQIDCLKAVHERDTVAILPTGYGKSLIFEILPIFVEQVYGIKSIAVIIAPLNAIIEQEIGKLGSFVCHVLKNEPLKSTGITHYIGHPEDILFHAETLGNIGKKVGKVFVIVDESHCVLDWGEDFRPDFRLISEIRPHLPREMKMLAITATASKQSQKEIARLLGMKNYTQLNTTPVMNDNVTLKILERIPCTGGSYTAQEAYNFVFKPLLLQLYSEEEDFPLTVVYCKLQWCGYGVELAQRLLGPAYRPSDTNDLPRVVQYHAQQPHDLNTAIIHRLSDSDSPIRLVFATIALGMGCDLRHVKRIIHAGPPSSLEVYTQEVGRAGRDGSKAEAILCYNATDLAQKHVEKSVKEFCKDRQSCRRVLISKYFDSQVSTPVHACCDICDKTSSHTLKTRQDVRIPSLTKRQQMFDILNAYRLSDISGDCQKYVTEHVIHVIADTFEYVQTAEEISKYFRQPDSIAESIYAIIKHVSSS